MKKYLILLLMGILPYLSLAQNKVENSYLSVTVPPGWHVQKQDMPGTKMELLNFFNDGPILYNMGIIVGIEQIQNPKAALEMQMSFKTTRCFIMPPSEKYIPQPSWGKTPCLLISPIR